MDGASVNSASSHQQHPSDSADRTNRFLSPTSDLGSNHLRERAASQPPRASVLSTPPTQHQQPSAGRGLQFTPRTSSGLNPNAIPGMPQSVPTRSSSFSTSPNTGLGNGFASAMREHRGFASTFEDDESDVLSEVAEEAGGYMPARGRSYAVDITRSRSQSLATTRQPPIGSPFTAAPAWPIPGATHGGIARYSDYRAPPLSRYGSLGANLARSPVGNGAARNDDISNISPFVRDVGQILLDDGSAFRELWAGMPRNEGGAGGGSGTTSRRHSVSVVQPRREIVGFHAPERDFSEDAPTTYNARAAFNPSALLTDDELADDLGMLHLGPPGSQHSRHASNEPGGMAGSIPIGGRSPPSSDRIGYQPLSLSIPQSSSFGTRSGGGDALGSPSARGFLDEASYLGGGASHAAAQALGARYIPGQGIQYPDALASPTYRSQFSPSRAAPPGRQQAFGAPAPPPITRRSSDAAATAPGGLDNVGKGVPLSAVPASWPLYIVEFKAGRTDLFYCTDLSLDIRADDLVVVEADRGKDLGKVINDTITLAEVEAFQKQQQARAGWASDGGQQTATNKEINPKMIFGKATAHEAQMLLSKQQDEEKALQLCQNKVRQKKLPMEVVDAEYQWDRRKLTFYFVAEKRIDFRELVRELFRLYKTRIWMASLQGTNYEQ